MEKSRKRGGEKEEQNLAKEKTLQTEPASRQREEELVRLGQEGNQEALDILFARYKRLARARAQLYYMAGGDGEDLMQEGMIGLFYAIRDFDPQKGMSFHAFAELCISRQILTAIRRASRKKHEPLNRSISLSGEDEAEGGLFKEVLYFDLSGQPEERLLQREAAADLAGAIQERLSPLERQVFSLMQEGLTYREIAEALKREEKSIDNAMQRIRSKVRRLFQKQASPAKEKEG